MKQKPTILRLMLVVLVIMLAVGIFMLSRQPATQSDDLSRRLASITLIYAQQWTSNDLSLTEWNHMLRKTAHFTLFGILASLILITAKLSRLSWGRAIALAFSCTVIYAIVDESHQWFVDGRGASIKDVLIDSSGALLGIAIVYIVGRRWLR